MIKICNMNEAKNFDGIVWAIVRSLKDSGSMIQVSVLSPDWDLLKGYLSAKDAGQWDYDAFTTWYASEFLNQIANDYNAINALRALVYKTNITNICLCCFCKDETLCHRSIIAGILQYYGVSVEGVSKDYSEYGKQFKLLLDDRRTIL